MRNVRDPNVEIKEKKNYKSTNLRKWNQAKYNLFMNSIDNVF